MDKLLDKEVHQLFKAPSLSTYLSSKTSSTTSNANSPLRPHPHSAAQSHDLAAAAQLQPIVPVMLPHGAASQAALGLVAAVADVNAALGATAGAAAALCERASEMNARIAHAEMMARKSTCALSHK